MSEEVVIKIEGMSCQHCVMRVEKGLTSVPGVEAAAVDLEKKEARVTIDPAQTGVEALKNAVAEAGYKAV